MATNQSIAVFTRMSTCSMAIGTMLALLLSACGGDSSSSGPSGNGTSDSDIMADTFDDLPVCSDKREGVIAYVKDKKIAYVCEDGDWSVDGDENQKSSSSRHCEDCKDETVSSNSTDKMSDTQGSSSSVTPSDGDVSCSSKVPEPAEGSSSSSFVFEQNSSAYEQPEVVAVKDKSISGVSQKGPFVTGSAVKLYELDGKTYAQTGKNFTGKITTDDGKFSMSSITLVSQYALLESNGYFRNEISGNKSKWPITLYALTDLSDRKTVNINLLTHLEYDRVLYLVDSGIDFPSAKKLAEDEILNAFGIKGEFANFEDLDIFSEGEGNAALLAFNVLVLGKLENEMQEIDVADLTELLTKFALDIEKDGVWDDEATKTKIADWAQMKDFSDEFATLRSNIERWNLGVVPVFEKYVRNFWYTNYGLGKCSASNEAEVLAVKNVHSTKYDTQIRYICKDGAWKEATNIEKDTYLWTAGEDGEIRIGDVTLKMYDYDAMIKAWREASTLEAALGGCTEAREADLCLNTGKVNGVWYICKGREWESTNSITVDTQGWINGRDGDLQKGDSTDTFYKYDDALNKWLTATHNDTTLKLMGCTTNRFGEIAQSTTNDTYYVCKNMDWQKAQKIDYDTYGEKCTAKEIGRIIDGVVIATNMYYCTTNGWVSLKDGWSWEVPKDARLNPEITYGTMTDSRDNKIYKTVKIGGQVWMAENLDYADSVKTPSLKGKNWCFNNVLENCAVTGRLYTWAAAIDSVKLGPDADNPQGCSYGVTCIPAIVHGICPDGWHLPAIDEWEILFDEVGGQLTAGKILKSQTGWRINGNGTDAYGFSALPAGYRTDYDRFNNTEGYDAYFWSVKDNDVFSIQFSHKYDNVVFCVGRGYGYSVRCVQD